MNKPIDRFQRCVNLDWLEVAVYEPANEPHDADYFRSRGWVVIEREYGTRVWGQMFTLEGEDHLSFIEVRRAPKSEVILSYVAHLRFVNRVCYFPNAAQLMLQFINDYHYDFCRIARVDVCMDFEKFDYGDLPRDFVRRYIADKYAKINQGDLAGRAKERWDGKIWNSLAWGSPKSDVGTKFYNKTMELYDPITKQYAKPYIRQSWFECGLVDDPTQVIKYKASGEAYTPEIWRLEFSIRSSVKNWFMINLDGKERSKQSIRNTLEMYDDRDKLLVLFAALQQHYFHFKHLLKRYKFYKDGHTDGEALKKYDCPDKLLFNWKSQTMLYKVAREEVATSEKVDTTLARLLAQLREFRDRTLDHSIKNASDVIIKYLEYRISHFDQSNPINKKEMQILRTALRNHLEMPWIDPAVLIRKAREEMAIRDEIDPFI